MNEGNPLHTVRARTPNSHISKMMPIHSQYPPSTDIDPSYTSDKRNITDLTISVPGSKARSLPPGSEPPPPRWHTLEFRLYTIAFILVVPIMVWIPMRLSLPSHPNYGKFQHRLSDGWMFGRKVDNSDAQYRSFRNNLFSLLLLASAYLLSSTFLQPLLASRLSRSKFIAIFSLGMITLLHGTSVFKILVLLYANYTFAKLRLPPSLGRFRQVAVIVGNMGILFLNERYDGYKFRDILPILGALDGWNGMLPRWHINFNITMLRMISFSLDYIWREELASNEPPVEYRKRVTESLPESEYSFTNYLAYTLYPPLYIAGPIMTFNDFTWQLRNPVPLSRKARISYGIRFVACLLTMEAVLHTMYVVAIKDSKGWEGDTPAELSMIGLWNLVVVWLKLLIPWRYFRLWALLDGLDPPENMIRCVVNNYSTLGFWRSWHRSFNLWVVRYIYIPVGGSKNVVLATLLVFTFVALWHDLSFKLLAWGWLVSLFILPEITARKIFTVEKYGDHSLYRHICAVGGVFNILLMMTANLVGFALGLEGTKHLIVQLTSTISGVLCTGALAIATQQQVPWSNSDLKHRNNAFDVFVKHFSDSRYGTDTFLQTQITNLYSNSSVVVTQDYNFDIFRYAAGSDGEIVIRELDEIESIKRTVFVKPSRRRDGDGWVGDRVVFGGWEVAWGDEEFKVIVATWPEGFFQVTQWHVISDNAASAHKLIQATAIFCSNLADVVWVFEQGYWRPDRELWQSIQDASWDDVVLDEDLKKSLQGDYQSFFKSEAIYKKFAVPWKRGLIFLGPPGNGKTISLKAIMKEVKVPPLYVKSFHNWLGDEAGIKEIFARARAEAPCVLILEDLDSLITDDNRSFFLNQVDGLENNDGLLIIGTTNHVERLDPALSNRPSRFDRKYTFPDPSYAQRRDYAIYWQNKLRTIKEIEFPDSLLDEFAEKTDKFSFAYMKEAFVSSLLIVATREVDGFDGKPVDFRTILLNQVKHLRDELETEDASATSNATHIRSSGGGGGGDGNGFFNSRSTEMEAMFGNQGMIFRYPNM
nr:uncharacterized protein CI109_002991 [Kwoniella shandongensis]KAA5528459.1 hypothetical protein CI109_002991 [Kwoniella shandongensis]